MVSVASYVGTAKTVLWDPSFGLPEEVGGPDNHRLPMRDLCVEPKPFVTAIPILETSFGHRELGLIVNSRIARGGCPSFQAFWSCISSLSRALVHRLAAYFKHDG
jgi:hypothetical protein